MIKQVKVINHLGKELILELSNPWETGVVVRSIKGIGPQKASINTSEVSTNDGSIFNSARLLQRNIVIDLNYIRAGIKTVEDVRHMVYTYFPVKKKVILEFKTTIDNDTRFRISRISGYVESNENTIFTNKEGTQISIICPDPRFYDASDAGPISMSFSNVTPTFSFELVDTDYVIPNGKESLTIEKTIYGAKNVYDAFEFGVTNVQQLAEIEYTGDDETGVKIVFQAIGPAKNPRIGLESKNQTIVINTEMETNDIITINTVKGHKSVTRTRAGTITNLLNYLDRRSKWFTLDYGINKFSFGADEGASNLQVTVSYDTIYEGI